MKCYYHPTVDAVAVCKSCGRGTCQQCTVIVSGTSYCKTCIETSRVQALTAQVLAPPINVPRPAGIPSRTHFIVGATGVIISGVAALFLLFGTGFFLSGLYWGSGSIVPTFATIILGVGVILAGVGYLGIKRNYGLGIGTAGFALSIVAAVFLFSMAVVNMMVPSYRYSYYYSSPWYVFFVAIGVVTYIMFGVMQILWGAAHIKSRQYTGTSGLALATGIILIISGSLTASVLINFVGLVLFFVCGILALLVFVMSKIPNQQMQSV